MGNSPYVTKFLKVQRGKKSQIYILEVHILSYIRKSQLYYSVAFCLTSENLKQTNKQKIGEECSCIMQAMANFRCVCLKVFHLVHVDSRNQALIDEKMTKFLVR